MNTAGGLVRLVIQVAGGALFTVGFLFLARRSPFLADLAGVLTPAQSAALRATLPSPGVPPPTLRGSYADLP